MIKQETGGDDGAGGDAAEISCMQAWHKRVNAVSQREKYLED